MTRRYVHLSPAALGRGDPALLDDPRYGPGFDDRGAELKPCAANPVQMLGPGWRRVPGVRRHETELLGEVHLRAARYHTVDNLRLACQP
jgi:hypothetical protein